MNKKQINELIESCALPDGCEQSRLIETPISWVILTAQYAFKIKKPVRLPDIDFSTLEKRYHYCKEELDLNRHQAPDVYLTILPITRRMLNSMAEDREDEIIDYSVQMKRLDQNRELHTLLQNQGVNKSDMDQLAGRIVLFHKNSKIIKNAFDTTGFQEAYAGIEQELTFITKKLGKEWGEKIEFCVVRSNVFLNAHRTFMNQRVISNKQRNCHGDLNTHNIYLYEKPVIINGIEYHAKYRHIDVLNDVAFLCMDLEFHNEPTLSEHFFQSYLQAWEEKEEEFTNKLLLYYKSYRANIQVRNTAALARQEEKDGIKLKMLETYLQLMYSYISAFA